MKRTLLALLFCVATSVGIQAGEAAVTIPAPQVDDKRAAGKLQTAVIAGGCFWGVQGVYQHLIGVKSVLSGYSGGSRDSADYRTVGGGESGHAESVQIVYDPAKVSYGQILQVFFSVVHDPTQLDRQGPDSGTQYRSAIFFTSPEQQKTAETVKLRVDKSGKWPKPIVTEITPAGTFTRAEEYHQDYLVKNPGGYTCHYMRE